MNALIYASLGVAIIIGVVLARRHKKMPRIR